MTCLPLHRTFLLSALCCALAFGLCGSPRVLAATPPPTTLEGQVEYLEGALAEGLRVRDWKMVELAATGFKAAKLSSAALEQSAVRAERLAALEALSTFAQQGTRSQIETWGLAARTLWGDEKARAALRALAKDKLTAVSAPTQEQWKNNRAEAAAAQKAFTAYTAALEKQDYATFCLALLKEPGVLELVVQRLSSRESSVNVFGSSPGTSQLVLAALATDPQAGFKALAEFCGSTDEKVSMGTQSQVLGLLFFYTRPAQNGGVNISPFGGFNQGGSDTFKIDTEIAATAPKDGGEKLMKPFNNLAQHAKADANGMSPVYNMVGQLPVIQGNQDEIQGLEAMKTKLTGPMAQYYAQSIDQVLNKVRGGAGTKEEAKAGSAAKPPAPPEGF